MGLNDSFSHARGQILMMDPLPSFHKAYSLNLQEERQREVGSGAVTSDSQLAFAIQAVGGKAKNGG